MLTQHLRTGCPSVPGQRRDWAAHSGGTLPLGLDERVPPRGEGDKDWDGNVEKDKDSPASQGQPEGTELSVLEAIPPAHSAFRDSSAERKADVTPCFWVQTIGIQERGAARLREPGVPSSARPALLRSALAVLVPCIPRRLGGPRPWLHPDVTWGVPSWRAQGGWVAPPTHGASALPQHPRVARCHRVGLRWRGYPACLPTEKGALEGLSGGARERPLLRAVALCHFPQARPGLGACWLTRQAAARRPAQRRSRRKAGPGAAGKPGPAPRSPHPAARPLNQQSPPEPGRRTRGAEEGGMGGRGAGWGQL